MFQFIRYFLVQFGQKLGFSSATSRFLTAMVIFIGLICITALLAYVIKLIITSVVKLTLRRRPNPWLAAMLAEKVFNRLAICAPAILMYKIIPEIFVAGSASAKFLMSLTNIYLIFNFTKLVSDFLNAMNDVLAQKEATKDKPVKSYMQVVKIILWVLSSILMISIIVDKSPAGILAGIGAFSAVLLLVFQDFITGFVHSIQLSGNDLVRIGDWITSPKYGVDGTVTEVNLVSVKVLNFDNTVISLPVKYIVTDSFQNWRNMQDSGIRRIARAVHIDVSCIKNCTSEMLERFRQIDLIGDYITEKQAEMEKYNAESPTDTDIAPNGRHLTNLGVLRIYMTAYLQKHPMVEENATLMVRQLQPDEFGLPLELYCFVKTTVWEEYERLQADLFDHFYAVLPYFDLRAYQRECEKGENAITKEKN